MRSDQLLDQLAALEKHDVDELRRHHIRQRAHALLGRRRPTLSGSRYLEPVLVCGFSALILAWAVERAVFLLL